MEDIGQKIHPRQFGGQKGSGTEHLIVCLVDRVLQLLDQNNTHSMVIMNGVDWMQAFDRNDPTNTTKKFIKIGLRPSLVSVLIDYMTGRKMKVKFNGKLSKLWNLVGGSPQGILVGQDCFIVSNRLLRKSRKPIHSFKNHESYLPRFKYGITLKLKLLQKNIR